MVLCSNNNSSFFSALFLFPLLLSLPFALFPLPSVIVVSLGRLGSLLAQRGLVEPILCCDTGSCGVWSRVLWTNLVGGLLLFVYWVDFAECWNKFCSSEGSPAELCVCVRVQTT